MADFLFVLDLRHALFKCASHPLVLQLDSDLQPCKQSLFATTTFRSVTGLV